MVKFINLLGTCKNIGRVLTLE